MEGAESQTCEAWACLNEIIFFSLGFPYVSLQDLKGLMFLSCEQIRVQNTLVAGSHPWPGAAIRSGPLPRPF